MKATVNRKHIKISLRFFFDVGCPLIDLFFGPIHGMSRIFFYAVPCCAASGDESYGQKREENRSHGILLLI